MLALLDNALTLESGTIIGLSVDSYHPKTDNLLRYAAGYGRMASANQIQA